MLKVTAGLLAAIGAAMSGLFASPHGGLTYWLIANAAVATSLAAYFAALGPVTLKEDPAVQQY